MDTSTNRLVTRERLELMDALEREKYTPVPEHLRRAAEKKLAGLSEATVSRQSGGALSKWAAEQRRLAKRNAAAKTESRRRMAKDSRRRNRKAGR